LTSKNKLSSIASAGSFQYLRKESEELCGQWEQQIVAFRFQRKMLNYCQLKKKMLRHNRAQIYMHLSIFLWGFTGVLGRGISLSEGVLVWWRMLLVCVSLGAQMWWWRKSLKISGKQLLQMASVGTLLMIHWLFFYGAIKYSNVSVTLSCFSTTSLFTALLEPLLTKKKFSISEIGFSLLGMVGIGFIFFDGSHFALGIFLAVTAAFLGSFFNILNKNIVKELSPDLVSFYEMTSGFVVLTLFLPLYLFLFPNTPFFPTASDWFLLMVLAFLCTHIALILSLAALKELSAFTLNLAVNLEPVYGIILAFIFFNENRFLGINFYIGSAIVLLSVLLHTWYSGVRSHD
jgi:drug/metabolite transporter (DMT)-like permease